LNKTASNLSVKHVDDGRDILTTEIFHSYKRVKNAKAGISIGKLIPVKRDMTVRFNSPTPRKNHISIVDTVPHAPFLNLPTLNMVLKSTKKTANYEMSKSEGNRKKKLEKRLNIYDNMRKRH